MDQHPIPSQISSYEFKLVGEMTLKQFLKAAVGIVLAVLINSTKIVFIIKWPLMIFFAGLGLALAFVPFQDRPLENWIIAFIKSIYSPTIYLYRKKRVENWLDLDLTKQEKNEEEDYDVVVPNYQKDNRKLKEFLRVLPNRREGRVIDGNVYEDNKEEEKVEAIKQEPVVAPEPVKEVPVGYEPKIIKEVVRLPEDWRSKQVNLDLKSEKLEATGQAVFGSVPMPNMSDVPNVISGMITDKTGKLVEGAIVEIMDENGNPSRVLKTNPLGQFKSSTPLTNGKYLIVIEKEGLIFDRINVILDGNVLQSLRIVPNN